MVLLLSYIGFTPAHLAACAGHVEALTALLDKGADLSIGCRNGYTPLHIAVEADKSKTVKALIEAKVHLNTPNNMGMTALHIAVKAGLVGVVEVLLQAGADCHLTNSEGLTPLALLEEDLKSFLEVAEDFSYPYIFGSPKASIESLKTIRGLLQPVGSVEVKGDG